MRTNEQIVRSSVKAIALQAATSVTTGLPDLDVLTGGLRAGQLWLIVGEVGAGRSTLALQFAAQACRAAEPTLYVSGRDQLADVLNRLPHHTSRDQGRIKNTLTPDELATVTDLPLDLIDFDDEPHGVPLLAQIEGGPSRRLVVIDDVDMYDADVGQFDRIVPSADPDTGLGMPERLWVWLRAGNSTVVVTRPTPHATGLAGQEIPTAWMRAADVVVRIERPDWVESSDPV